MRHRHPCICPRCRPSGFSLHDIAPRLARARDGLLEERRLARIARDRYGAELLHLERLLAHRELQLARAYATGNGPYIAARQRKLREAKAFLATHVTRGVVQRAAA